MKPITNYSNKSCVNSGCYAASSKCGSLNQNVHTPATGGLFLFIRHLTSGRLSMTCRHFGTVLLLLFITSVLSAQTTIFNVGDVFEMNGIHYKITKFGLASGNTVAVYNGGANYNGYTGNVIIPDQVTFSSKVFDVTSLDDGAFINCYSLDSVFIPGTVVSIGKRAFRNCYELKNMTIPNSVYNIGEAAFYTCRNIRKVILPKDLSVISDSMFYQCSLLLNFQLPEKITSIGNAAFYSAFTSRYSLKSLIIPDKVISIGDYAFYGNSYLNKISIANSVVTIGQFAFGRCGLDTLKIPNSVTTIGNAAFYECTNLQSLQLSNSLTALETNIFNYCTSLRSVTVPNSVRTIGGAAFANCSMLNEVVLPNTITTIGESAFSRCIYLNTLNLPGSVTSIKEYAFSDCEKLSTTMLINQNLNEIGKNAFRYTDVSLDVSMDNKYFSSLNGVLLDKLKTVVLHCPFSKTSFNFPNTVKKIEKYAFTKCKFTNVVLPNDLDSIQGFAFQNCKELSQLTLPATLKAIDESAFGGCTALQKIRAYMENPPQIFTTVFTSVPTTCVLQVPLNSLDLYKAANGWKNLSVISFGGAIGASFNANGVYYKIISETEAKVIAHPSGNHNYTGVKNIPSTVSYLDVNYEVTSIDKSAFAYSGVTSVSIPGSVKFIGEWAFTNCQTLTGIVIPNMVTFIGKGAFSSCPILTSAVLSNTLTSIEEALFQSCPALTNMVIPASVLSIGEYSFDGCYGLVTLDIPQSVTRIGKWAFQLCRELQSINISDNVEILPDYVFWGCESLEQVKMPASLKEIGVEVFYNCPELSEIDIPGSVTGIGAGAFQSTGLRTVSIPASVNFIGQFAFNCSSLNDVYIYNRVPVGITREVFSGIYMPQANLYVRSRSIPLYKSTAVWKEFQIKSIESIHTTAIRELTGRDIEVQVRTMLVESEDNFTAFQFEMKYDTIRMVFKDFSTENMMTNAGSVMVNSSSKGILKVGYMSNNYLAGEGNLINLRFTLRNSGIVYPELKRFLYNSFDLSNFTPGAIEVIAYGDVDYNQEVQSYDGSLVLINSVGLNPIPDMDSYPWEALRNDVADVDGTNTLTATDAGLILRKSVDLIGSFPIENSVPSPVGKSTKIKASENADVTVKQEDYKLVFRSYGDFVGMNLSITGDLTALDMPIISTSVLHAKNISVDEYNVGLAASIPPADGSVIMQIPLKKKITEEMILTLNINNQTKVITIDNSTSGTNATDAAKMHFYPNPATDYIYFSADYQFADVRITDSRGAIVHQEKISDQGTVSLQSLTNGIYFVTVTDAEGRISTSKLMKK